MTLVWAYENPLVGTLRRRYKRFLADVELADGQTVTAHCPNTGPMTGVCTPGSPVLLLPSTNPQRKLAYTWEAIAVDG
ncbi:MAG: DNA/RNA nuclease SfsA, partial [Pseudanabaenaceae cyanobacterium]